MIIKSMSRKSKSFSQLFNYMKSGSSRNSEHDFFTQNLYSSNAKGITGEFLENSRWIKARRNGNYLFHEVISITKSKQLNLAQEKERLFDIVRYYAKSRCQNNLVAGFLHDEKSNNVHFHLMISSNEAGEHHNQRLTKYSFNKIKKETEKYVIEKYPELEQDIIINAQKDKKKEVLSKNAWEIKRKGGRLEKKEKITDTLKSLFESCQSKAELFTQLSTQRIEMYNRGNSIGFITLDDGKKYRLKTLGLVAEFNAIEEILKPNEKPSTKASPESKQQTNNKSESQQEPNDKSEVHKRKDEIKHSRHKSSENNKSNSTDKDK